MEGHDTCSAWAPLDPVARESAIEFVRGSHAWPPMRQPNFAGMTTQDDARDQVAYDVDGADAHLAPFPDVEGDRGAHDIVGWAMEPGDVVVFNGRAVHGGSGNLARGRGLRVFNTQWCGDDVRVRFRESGMDPDHTDAMRGVGLNDGDRLGNTDLYPMVWCDSRN